MKDFSIQSILADTIVINDQCEKCQRQNNEKTCETTDSEISAMEINFTRRKDHLCTTRNPKNIVETDRGESGVGLRNNSGIDKQQFLIDKLIKFDLNKIDDAKVKEEIDALSNTKSKRRLFTEFNVICRSANNNSLNERQRRNSARRLRTNNKIRRDANRRSRDRWPANCLNENSGNELSQCDRLTIEANSNYLLSDIRKKTEDERLKDDTESLQMLRSKLEWLHCTRYKPPKVPRKSRADKHKRRVSLDPRIPFTTHQLDVLEQKFCNSAYLSKNDVLELSTALKLPPKKVKIWFQNRRAKERRDSRSST